MQCTVKGQSLLPSSNQASSFCSGASEMAGHDSFKRPEDIRRPQSGTSEHCGVTGTVPWQTTCRPLTKCCSPWMRLSLPSVANCWTSLSLSLSCSLWHLLGKIFCTGRWKVEKMWLESGEAWDEKKPQSCSTSSSASDGAIFHGAICESASRTSKTLRLCGHLWSSGSCFNCGMSTSPSLCLDVFGHMTCSPPKLGLTNSRCFAQWQQKI